MMRIFNICVIAALLLAASDVYKIKFESTRQVERVAKLRNEIRGEQDAIAALRAEWSRLDTPARIEHLARRHLALKPVDAHQYDRLDSLPARPPDLVPVDEPDPIGTLIADPRLLPGSATGSIAGSGKR
jgi:cell division protein FtsL